MSMQIKIIISNIVSMRAQSCMQTRPGTPHTNFFQTLPPFCYGGSRSERRLYAYLSTRKPSRSLGPSKYYSSSKLWLREATHRPGKLPICPPVSSMEPQQVTPVSSHHAGLLSLPSLPTVMQLPLSIL